MSFANMPSYCKQHFINIFIVLIVTAFGTNAEILEALTSSAAPLFSKHGARCVRMLNSEFQTQTEFATMANMESEHSINCPNLMAVFQDEDEAVDFLDSDLAFGFVRPTSLAVAVVLDQIANVSDVAEIMTTRAFKSALEVALIVKLGNSSTYTVLAHDVSGGADTTKAIDVWNEQKSNFILSGQHFFTESMRNLHGRTIKACSFDFAPFSTSKSAKPGEKAVYDGIELKTFYEVADIMNFKYEVNEPKTGVKWGGIMSDVIKGVADIGTGHLFLTRGRALVADPTPAINVDYFCFLVPQAKAEARWKALHRPLEPNTWLGLVITLLFCVLFVMLYFWLHPYPELKFDKLIFYMVGTIIDNSHEETFHIKGNSLRIFVTLFLLGFYVITMGYRGSLISHQLVPTQQKPLETIQDVLDSPYNVYSLGRVVKDQLKYSTDPLMRELDKKYFIHNNLGEAFKNVSRGERVLIEVQQMSNYRIANGFIDRYGVPGIHVGDCLSHYEIVFYMTKNSIYGPAVSQVIEGLKEAGITDKLVKDGTGATRVKTSSSNEDNSLSLNAMQGPFVFGGLLLAVASVVLMMEVLRGNRNYKGLHN